MRAFAASCIMVMIVPAWSMAAPVAKPLRGTVTTADGKPAGGAIVWAAKYSRGPLERGSAVADAGGRYSLKLAPGRWYVWARHGTQGAEAPGQHESIDISAEQAPDELNIQLEERGTFRGRLLEAETGKPIVGGQLHLDAGLVLTTQADGKFEMGGLHRSNHEAFIVAPGRLRMRVLFDTTAKPDTELEVLVPRAGRIVGRVTDADGKPIAGAFVGRSTSGTVFSIRALYTPCDAEGRFEYDDAVSPDQPTRLAAFAPGYVDDQHEGISPGPLDKPLEFQFRLQPTPSNEPTGKGDKRRIVSGVVLAPTEVPLAGIAVRWGLSPRFGAPQMRTDDKGRFRLVVPDQAGELVIMPRDFAPEFPHVAAGGDKDLVVRLRFGRTVRGRVVDEDGKPIRNVSVYASGIPEKYVRTDADGKFVATGMPDNAGLDLGKAGLTGLQNIPLGENEADNTVTMQYGGAIKGRAVDRNGKPLRHFRVLMAFPKARLPGEQTEGFFAGYSGMGVRFTSADGSFVLTGVGAGSVYRVRVLADGHGEAVEDRVTAVPINRLEKTAAVTLRAGPPVALRVRALNADGKIIAGARVTLVDGQPDLDHTFHWGYDDASWHYMFRARTAANGWADLPPLSISAATVLVRAPGFARQRLSWRNGQKELTAKLVAECVLTGNIRVPAGDAAKLFYVHLASTDGDRISVPVGPKDQGRFRVAELPASKWTVTVRASGEPAILHESQITLKPGEAKNVTIDTK